MTHVALVIVQTLAWLALAEGGARLAEWLRPGGDDIAFDYAPYRMLRMVRAPPENVMSKGPVTFASLLAGLVWDRSGPTAAFLIGSVFAVLALIALGVLRMVQRRSPTR